MALRLCDVRRDTIANRILDQLMHHYNVAEGTGRLVLTKKAGDMNSSCMTSTTFINWISSITGRS
jgi:hypothetical protein